MDLYFFGKKSAIATLKRIFNVWLAFEEGAIFGMKACSTTIRNRIILVISEKTGFQISTLTDHFNIKTVNYIDKNFAHGYGTLCLGRNSTLYLGFSWHNQNVMYSSNFIDLEPFPRIGWKQLQKASSLYFVFYIQWILRFVDPRFVDGFLGQEKSTNLVREDSLVDKKIIFSSIWRSQFLIEALG